MRLLFALGCFVCGCVAQAQLLSQPHGASITIDSVTTEITVITPSMVEVTKYVGERPQLSGFRPETTSLPDSLPRKEGAGKLKIDTGRFYAAVNAKDGNVSFWDHDGNLILAEQHRSASFAPSGKTGRYKLSQDFQMGLAKVDSMYCCTLPAAERKNLRGRRVEFGAGHDGCPQPYVATEKGFLIKWNTPGEGYIDDTPERQVKKPGDVTFGSPDAAAIHYYFILGKE